ncbi:MAG TPA: type IV pilus twitching motility protein PilT [Actinomycetota bacterium]|nr:type IV pilus twitching motility protein PilT [Actinomycetota bacterium]
MGEEVGRTLVARGLVTEEQLESARVEGERTGVPPWRVLLQRNLVTEADVDAAVAATASAPRAASVPSAPAPPPAAPLPPRPSPGANGANGNGTAGDAPKLATLPPGALAPPPAPQLSPPPVAAAPPPASHAAAPVAPAPAHGAPGPAPAHGVPGPGAEPAPEPEERDPNLADFLEAVIDGSGSDLHLTAGLPPMIRVHGELRPIEGFRRLKPVDLQELIYSFLTQKQRETFEENLELDVSYSLPGRARFRVNVFRQRDALGSVMRLIPFDIVPLEKLGLPPSVREFCDLKRGLVLVTGITGSGKSTTLAGMIDVINARRREHIMTVEDPIEFLHRHKKSVVNQREVGTDTKGFAHALKHALRQDPDVILVGELRDLETISTALTAAETGHLVFATLHTQDAPQSVDRIVDVFPPHQQQQIRVQLAGTIAGVVSQQLLRKRSGGRIVAAEVMVATPAVRNLIREGKTHQIYTSLQAGGKFGMQVMDQHLADLVRTGEVTYEGALEHCHRVDEFNRLLGKG